MLTRFLVTVECGAVCEEYIVYAANEFSAKVKASQMFEDDFPSYYDYEVTKIEPV